MHTHNHLYEILEALVAAKVEFIVAGGVAVVLQGVERATMDLDLSVKMDFDNLRSFLSVMTRMGLTPRAPVPAESLLNPKSVQKMVVEKHAVVFTFIDLKNPFRQVDVFLKPELSFENLLGGSDTIVVSGKDILVLSKETLISLKKQIIPKREKDQFDIQALRRLMGKNS